MRENSTRNTVLLQTFLLQQVRFRHYDNLHHNRKSFFFLCGAPIDLSRSVTITLSLNSAKNG